MKDCIAKGMIAVGVLILVAFGILHALGIFL